MGQRHAALEMVHQNWLDVPLVVAAGGAVAHMAHGDGAGPQLRQALPGKHLVHQAHIPVGGKHAIVIDNNSGALLSPVLQGVQRIIGIGRHIGGLRRSNAEHAAFFMDMALPAPALSPRHGSAAAS